MEVNLSNGKYVLAVSGGVDSMVLLDILIRQPGVELVVAHLNHGIRHDSHKDERLVAGIAEQRGLIFEAGKAELGENASEEKARDVRYKFLDEIKSKHKADGIITAHHQDDLIETAIINVLRGTGPRGLVSMSSNEKIIRPLLHVAKSQIVKYAKDNKITWRQDASNDDTKYLRNYVRLNLVPRLGDEGRKKILNNIDSISSAQRHSDKLIEVLAQEVMNGKIIDRAKFINLPLEIGNELLVFWLRNMEVKDFDKKIISRLSMALKTAKPGTRHDVIKGMSIKMNAKTATIKVNR